MSLCLVHSRALLGLEAARITVEVHLANGLPSFTLVGLADTEVKEARERVRCAIQNAGLEFPQNKRITVNLAPADLPKDSGRFDLPIALGILAAAGQLSGEALARYEFAGELSLSGELRPVSGALAMALAMRREGTGDEPRLVLPMDSARETARVPGLAVYGAVHLLDLIEPFGPAGARRSGDAPSTDEAGVHAHPDAASPDASAAAASHATAFVRLHADDRPGPCAPHGPDLADVKGQAAARRALEVAAAGGHALLMVGPPGSGKSMLAQRFAGLLPPMTIDEALESAAVASLVGREAAIGWMRRPLRAPHHTASAVALVGGGSPPRPGEISLAHHGVLFLDELPEFPRSALEALREPLETGHICIARSARRAEFPARFQLVAAMNPCPCGHRGSTVRECRCTPQQVARYQARLSGPLLDRIDLQVEVPALPSDELLRAGPGEPSAVVRARVVAARERMHARQGCANAALAGPALDRHAALDERGARLLQQAATRLGWSARATHRVLRVARSIADLGGSAAIRTADLAEALQYRSP